jgi:hypothetical protein
MIPFRLGCERDAQDRRDRYHDRYRLAAPAPFPLPSIASVSDFQKIMNQGQTGSCTGHAAAWAITQILASRGMQVPELSPWFTWWAGRQLEGVAGKDSGVQLRETFSSMQKFGLLPGALWVPLSPVLSEPGQDLQTIAKALTIPAYERCETLQDIKYAIAVEGQSVVLGVPVTAKWFEPYTQKTGNILYAYGEDLTIGRHAVAACGYDDVRKKVEVANSWGAGVGNRGFFYIPYELFDGEWFDAWTVGYDALPDRKI